MRHTARPWVRLAEETGVRCADRLWVRAEDLGARLEVALGTGLASGEISQNLPGQPRHMRGIGPMKKPSPYGFKCYDCDERRGSQFCKVVADWPVRSRIISAVVSLLARLFEGCAGDGACLCPAGLISLMPECHGSREIAVEHQPKPGRASDGKSRGISRSDRPFECPHQGSNLGPAD